jgi:DeoR/GlpR family transcriptional regulator of sugar metabolism
LFAVERRNKLIALLNEKASISVQEAALYFGVAEETIRRDLSALESRKLLVRTHGGAVLSDSKPEISYEMRKRINISGKDSIGKEAAKLVSDGDTIILDASTSAFFLARHIKNKKGVTVISNAENVIKELSETEEIEVISTGGVLRRKSMSYVGRIAEESLRNYRANKLFFSCMGFSLQNGLTDSNGQESDMKKIMISCSQTICLLCDHTKFDRVGYASTAGAEDIDMLITDRPLSADLSHKITALDIKAVISD